MGREHSKCHSTHSKDNTALEAEGLHRASRLWGKRESPTITPAIISEFTEHVLCLNILHTCPSYFISVLQIKMFRNVI